MPEVGVGSPDDPDREFWILHQRWHVHETELNVDDRYVVTTSEMEGAGIVVCSTDSLEIAEHIARQHNAHVHTGEVLTRLRELRDEYHRHLAGDT